jgi:hypothetical protein
VTRCHICGKPCVREIEPAFGELPAETEPDVWEVVLRNRLIFPACDQCWGVWPDDWKVFPAEGFGRWPEEDRAPAESRTRPDFSLADLVDVLKETAP